MAGDFHDIEKTMDLRKHDDAPSESPSQKSSSLGFLGNIANTYKTKPGDGNDAVASKEGQIIVEQEPVSPVVDRPDKKNIDKEIGKLVRTPTPPMSLPPTPDSKTKRDSVLKKSRSARTSELVRGKTPSVTPPRSQSRSKSGDIAEDDALLQEEPLVTEKRSAIDRREQKLSDMVRKFESKSRHRRSTDSRRRRHRSRKVDSIKQFERDKLNYALKAQALARLQQFIGRGFPVSRTFTSYDEYHEIMIEVGKFEHLDQRNNKILKARGPFMYVVSTVTWLLTHDYCPYFMRCNIKSWPTETIADIHEYDDELEECYDSFVQAFGLTSGNPFLRLMMHAGSNLAKHNMEKNYLHGETMDAKPQLMPITPKPDAVHLTSPVPMQ